ncbi:MAG: hypothetical protein JWN48_963 [Myxococcaceae bacterium]|nr:hypothetical protein [Myxococcaceae bacterium]
MAKVLIDGNAVDIRFSLLERVVLAERSRKLPLARIRSVDPHPPLLDMMVHWSDQSGSWLCGVSAYDGHMVPSARHPGSTLAIQLDGEEHERIYIEVDDESPVSAAERIERALFESHEDGGDYVPRQSATELYDARQTPAPAPYADASAQQQRAARASEAQAERQAALLEALDIELEEEEIRHRDPLMQGSLPPGPMPHAEPLPELKLADDRDLSRLGSWLVGVGSLALLAGGVMIASGALPGLLAVGAGVTAALLGGVALAVVARHQD